MNAIKIKLPPLAVKNGVFIEPDEITIVAPFDKVRKLRLQIDGLRATGAENWQASSLLQYDLLLLEGVLRASVSAESGAVIVYDGKKTSAQELVEFARAKLQKLASSASLKLAEDVEFDYAKLIREGYHSLN